jgi:hypothetical protein
MTGAMIWRTLRLLMARLLIWIVKTLLAVTGAYGDDKGGFGRPFRLLEAGP